MTGRYDCSLLRRHNWFMYTPFGYTLTHRYFMLDTLHHIKNWIDTGKYNYWKA